MKRIIDFIEKKKKELVDENLFKWLRNDTIDGYLRLSFSPSMLYYLMGFKDVLSFLTRSNPENTIEEHINAYCGEDAEHWRWYLRDLEKLGCKIDIWGETIPKWCNEVWGPHVDINRKTIFHLISYAKSCVDPLLSVSLIMVFEATGVIFIGHTRKAAISIGMDNELKYFGKIHYEEEFGHTVQAQDFEQYTMTEETFSLAIPMIENLFNDYKQLFNCWYENRTRFSSKISHKILLDV